MNLEMKIPPLLVTALCALLMWLAAGQAVSGSLTGIALAGLFAVSGLGILLAGVLAFRQARTTVDPLAPERASEIVSNGVYGFSRNPMYLGMACLLAAWAAWLDRWPAWLGVAAFAVWITRFQIVPEERILEQKFGEPYAEYKRQVRRWI